MADHSWNVVDPTLAIKELDLSAFIYKGTGIPVDVREFFSVEHLSQGETRELQLLNDGNTYHAYIRLGKNNRTRMFWYADLSKLLSTTFPNEYKAHTNDEPLTSDPPIMTFRRTLGDPTCYTISLSYTRESEMIKVDTIKEQEEIFSNPEGTIKYFHGKRYERDTRNRALAIKLHGLTCKACDFNFERFYGPQGKDYIEIHHVTPISEFKGQTVNIDPKTDLVPLCSNCHRMVHRKPKVLLSVEDLRSIVRHNKKTTH